MTDSNRFELPPRSKPMKTPGAGGEPDVAAVGDANSERVIDPRIRIQHELVRVRREAEAARLEANAARLEASAERLEEMIERIDAGEILSDFELAKIGFEASPESGVKTRSVSGTTCEDDVHWLPDVAPEREPAAIFRFESWDAIRKARQASASVVDSTRQARVDTGHSRIRRPRMHSIIATDDESIGSVSDQATWVPESPKTDSTQTESPQTESQELDSPRVPAPETPSKVPGFAGTGNRPESDPIVADWIGRENDAAIERAESLETLDSGISDAGISDAGISDWEKFDAGALGIVALDEDEGRAGPSRRGRPIALVLSAVVHTLILVLLGGFTLTTVIPKDQVALSASTGESTESAMETFQIESVESLAEPIETSASETQYDVSPIGEMANVDVASDVVAAVSQPLASAAALSQPNFQDSPALQSLKSDTKAKMQFCGVEGGGNHFVYLVDSSGSMGDAFVSARRALLDSIEMLSPQQRFYVIFFDAKCDYMRITRADQDEPRSVYATVENKQRLKTWAMRVSMDKGKAPYEPLEYALQTLKPDVIFLLSDGEFPEKIETILKENNLVTNLFGDEAPVSIIHTISYYSREGESRMRRIAEQNYGQYRHVPKPKSN